MTTTTITMTGTEFGRRARERFVRDFGRGPLGPNRACGPEERRTFADHGAALEAAPEDETEGPEWMNAFYRAYYA